jgi:hypothetical protein
VTSLPAFGDVLAGEPVLFDGSVSSDNPIARSNYAAYTACDEDTCPLGYRPENMRITLEGGDVTSRNTDFQASAWPAANNLPDPFSAAAYRAPGEPVLVAGIRDAAGTVWADLVTWARTAPRFSD